ncbi:ATP-binding cassette domain-containing protein [Streptomyces sp. Wb2n-11]|uniref:ATP-binding cassette domain-containing protein n=1 Tax=Streptomyces sp. Wb2n-11 TaxID=1030533 RepID=UPI000B82E12F
MRPRRRRRRAAGCAGCGCARRNHRAAAQGLDIPLGGERLLSGGQRQGLSLARALLTDADLFLLDEATSQLDPAGEQHVLRTLERMAATRPVLMATHRPYVSPGAAHAITIQPLPHTAASHHRHDRLAGVSGHLVTPGRSTPMRQLPARPQPTSAPFDDRHT